jgi:hypothetical protein
MPTLGTPAFDALTILEIEGIDYREGSPSLVGHAAFVNTKTGKTHGKTTLRQWSKPTLQKLEELRLAMEEDMAKANFVTAGEDAPRQLSEHEPGGIGEHVGPAADDAPSI